jgi:hypothetical protein
LFKKLTRAILIAGLATGILGVAPVQAYTYTDCDTDGAYGSQQQIGRVVRDTTDWSGGYDAVRGNMRVGDLRSCTNPNSTATIGQSSAYVNLDWDGGSCGGTSCIIQLGYGMQDCSPVTTCNIPDNTLSWLYTPSDNTGGYVDDWTGIPAPVINRVYDLRIALATGGTQWRMDIIDTFNSAQYTRYITAHTTVTRAAFWMFEVHNKGDRLGEHEFNGWAEIEPSATAQ